MKDVMSKNSDQVFDYDSAVFIIDVITDVLDAVDNRYTIQSNPELSKLSELYETAIIDLTDLKSHLDGAADSLIELLPDRLDDFAYLESSWPSTRVQLITLRDRLSRCHSDITQRSKELDCSREYIDRIINDFIAKPGLTASDIETSSKAIRKNYLNGARSYSRLSDIKYLDNELTLGSKSIAVNGAKQRSILGILFFSNGKPKKIKLDLLAILDEYDENYKPDKLSLEIKKWQSVKDSLNAKIKSELVITTDMILYKDKEFCLNPDIFN